MEKEYFEALYPDTARFKEIEELSAFIKNGASSQLISLPGVGRATILGLLTHNKKVRVKHFGKEEENLHFVLVNFSEIRNRSLFDTMKFLFLCLSDSLRERKKEEYKAIDKLFKEALRFNDELVLFQKLKEAIDYLSLEKKLKLVMLFDRFEEYVPQVTGEFFTNLRTLRTRAKYQFLVVFSVNRPLEDLLSSQLSDFYEFIAGNYVYLLLYDKDATIARVSYIEKVTGKKIPAEVFDKIILETGGVGKLIKLSVELFLAGKVSTSEKDLGQKLFSQKSIQEALKEICRSLLPSEQNALIKKNFDDKTITEYLEEVGLLSKNKIQIPLFDLHMQEHITEFRGRDQKIIYDENTNSIRLGESILSDQLTASEFRLLRFFLQNSGQIVDRDAIIGIVWSDVKSTAGITDQAVDQLIFRLRRKIEEDPNHPAHIITVKGRGFKFTT